MRLTIDANVWIGALDARDPFAASCRACLLKAKAVSAELYSPLLLTVEVAAAIGRKTQNARNARLAAQWVRNFTGHHWLPLSEEQANTAERVATAHFLRGADAVYVAAAYLSDAVLLTYDNDVIDRATKAARIMTPDTWLALVEKN